MPYLAVHLENLFKALVGRLDANFHCVPMSGVIMVALLIVNVFNKIFLLVFYWLLVAFMAWVYEHSCRN